MNVLKELEDLKKEAEGIDPETLTEDEGDDLPEEVVEEPVEEEKPEEPAKEEEPVKEEVKEEPEEKPDAAAFARMRRELAALKKSQQQPAKVEEAPEPEAAFQAELVEAVLDRRKEKAAKEFERLEVDFARTTPGYEDTEDAIGVATQYKTMLYNSIKVQNPRMSHGQILEQTREVLLKKAGSYLNEGFDPFEEMYNEAVALGIKPQSRQTEQPAKEEKPLKPDLSKLAENQKRNAGTAAARGGTASQGPVSREYAASMSVKDWASLDPMEKKRLLAG